MSSAFFIALRRLRAPLIVLILIFAIFISGLVLIPGVDNEGHPWRMDFLHALYFASYTATTIGFGEIPYSFTDAQRLWVTACIFLSVIGWAYAIGKLLDVVQDPGFRQAVLRERFELAVGKLHEPFFLICGYGDAGRLMSSSLDHLNLRFVVLDHEPRNIDELELQDYRASSPAFAGDASLPENLQLAGLTHHHCRGVLALTGDDAANLAVAIAARLLNPAIPALCRANHPETAANMASFGTRHIINPYETFGKDLALAIRSSGSCQLLEWLTGMPGTQLQQSLEPPKGNWVICGQGLFGKAVIRQIQGEALTLTLIDPNPSEIPGLHYIQGFGTQAETLREAGIEQAVGLIAGTNNDVDNLSIVVTARELNPKLFVVLRQNRSANHELFEALHANFTMLPSEIITHECLGILTTPLLSRFLEIVKHRDDAWADAVIERLTAALGVEVPGIWQVAVTDKAAPELVRALKKKPISLDVLRRHPGNRDSLMSCLPLLVIRDEQETELPDWDWVLRENDTILFAGTPDTKLEQTSICVNPEILDYLITGRRQANSWVWRKLAGTTSPG